MEIQHRTDRIPQDITPAEALQYLKEGNFRFINNLQTNRDLLELVNVTRHGQWPFAVILSCMDSRTSAELIFEQGLGDIFSIRIAGNVITEDILGCLEYATVVAGSRLIVVLGHSNCGAVKGACDHVELGNLTGLLARIQPAVMMEHSVKENRDGGNPDFVNAVAYLNAVYSSQQITHESAEIKKLVDGGKVGIIPAMYNVSSGKVTFYEQESTLTIGRTNSGRT